MWFLSLSINYINVADVFSELLSKKQTKQNKTQNIVYLGKYSTNSVSWFPYQRTINFSTSSWKHNSIWSWPEKWPHGNPISTWGISQAKNHHESPFFHLLAATAHFNSTWEFFSSSFLQELIEWPDFYNGLTFLLPQGMGMQVLCTFKVLQRNCTKT